MDFRTGISDEVTASDASTSGGGLCVSKVFCRGDILSQEDVEPILVVSLFDGIGALRVAVDALRVPVAGYIGGDLRRCTTSC